MFVVFVATLTFTRESRWWQRLAQAFKLLHTPPLSASIPQNVPNNKSREWIVFVVSTMRKNTS